LGRACNPGDRALPLSEKIVLVTGATRGAGRGIACMLMRSVNFPNYDRLKHCDDGFYEYCIGLFE